ncbi:probable pectinesterase 66 [Mercurialis annua]|uniref:probable pectinesterase 66 n=1 Tax=Mercurialis annua TaxID=3986 RepID=UPI00215E1F1F|nr:probable pectinesterase 66 [Mercurialis annua]
MQLLDSNLLNVIMLILCYITATTCKALNCQLHDFKNVAYTISVHKSGRANFTTIQSAIDSIPDRNSRWIRIQFSPEREKVTIPENKPCIFLQGAGRKLTIIEWGDHETTNTSATFTSFSDNIIARGITFKNTYNLVEKPNRRDWKQAVAARIRGDKSAFYHCAFQGVQDTLWDEKGCHLFKKCYIEGSVDFIFGKAKSIYERCLIYVNIGRYKPELKGYITAQKREGNMKMDLCSKIQKLEELVKLILEEHGDLILL